MSGRSTPTRLAPLLLLAGLLGCPRAVAPPALPAPAPPVGQGVAEVQVRAVLEAGAADLDVDTRRRALAVLIRRDPAPGGGEWGPRGAAETDLFVLRAVADALADRLPEPRAAELLRRIAESPAAHPLARGHAAWRLVRAAPAAETGWAAALAAATPGWDALGLHLAAAAGGHAPSAAALADHLRSGELPLDLGFLRDLGAAPPPGAADALREGLLRLEPELRPAGLVALYAVSPGDSAVGLVAAVRGGDEETALDVLERVDELEDALAVPILRAGRAGTPAVRAAAGLRLVGRGLEAPAAALRALSGQDAELRTLAARALGGWLSRAPGGDERVREALRAATAAEDPGLQLAAVQALAVAPAAADLDALRARLDDESLLLRVVACEALLAR